MRKILPAIIIIVIVLALGYVGRHKIKALLGMNSTAPVAQTEATPSTPPSPTP